MFCKKVLILYVVSTIIFIRVLSFDGTAPNKHKTPQPLVAVTFIIQIIRIVPESGAVCVICSWLILLLCFFRLLVQVLLEVVFDVADLREIGRASCRE